MVKAPLTDCQDHICYIKDDTNTSDICRINLGAGGVTRGTTAKEQAARWRQSRHSHIHLTKGWWELWV